MILGRLGKVLWELWYKVIEVSISPTKLSRLDSNQRIQESKSCALPLGDGSEFGGRPEGVWLPTTSIRRKYVSQKTL